MILSDRIEFNYELFKKLRQAQHKTIDNDEFKWFEESYKAFKNFPLNDKKDLIYIIAFAYSWMPTMANFKSPIDKDLSDLIGKINSFNGLNSLNEFVNKEPLAKEILLSLVPIVNNSIVGTSKVLHFVNPNLFPIFDSRVLKGLNKILSSANYKLVPKYILSYPDKAIALYLEYLKLMIRWLTVVNSEEPSITIRDLEVLVYLYG
jgi:hypothetical protein